LPRNKRLYAEAALVYAAAIWGSTFFVVKDVLAYIDPVVLVGYRFTLAALLIGAFLLARRQPLWQNFRQGFTLGFILWVLYIAQTVGLGITTASNSGFITGLFIVFVPLVNWLLYRIRARVLQLAAVLLALLGLWLLTGGIHGVNAGDLMTLAAAVTYALHVVFAGRMMARNIDPWVLNFQQILVIGVLGLATAVVQSLVRAAAHGQHPTDVLAQDFSVVSAWAWGIVLFLVLFPTITAYIAQLYGQRVVSATRAALLFTLEPVFAAVFAWTLGGEQMRLWGAIGGALMVAAMLLSEMSWNGKAKADLNEQSVEHEPND
jgi:drug/metabolite transporter (DMT)-like permease